MSKNTCVNCKYWERTDEYPVKGLKLGTCKMVKMFWDCTEWGEAKDDYARRLRDEFKDQKAFAQDGSDYIAYLITREEFGCNQFQKINNEDTNQNNG